jgi:FMN phosphatase YigB (HAD superfamily)
MIKNIIFDVDCVLLDWYEGMASFLRDRKPECGVASKGDMRRFPINQERDVLYGGIKIPKPLLDEFHASEHFARLPAVDGAAEAVKALDADGKLLFVLTSCGDEFAQSRRDYLREVFGEAFKSIEVAPLGAGKEEVLGRMLSKHGLVPGETLFLDDMIDNIASGDRLGVNAIHMLSGFNVAAPLSMRHVPQVRGMREFLRYVRYMDEKLDVSDLEARYAGEVMAVSR